MEKDKKIKVINKFNGSVGYKIPQLGINRTYYPKETKEISFEELQKLSFIPGGQEILKNYLEITDKSAVMDLFNIKLEPEYYYSESDIKRIMISGSLDQFLDLLDFSPAGNIDVIKSLAVELPLNDVQKRNAIQKKFGFNINKAIEIKNTKYDGDSTEKEEREAPKRRVATQKTTPTASGRRYKPENK